MSRYIFGYGSLLSRASRHRTFVESELYKQVELRGYQRILNACCGEYLAMNIRPNTDVSIMGVVMKVEDKDFPALTQREGGYELIEVTQAVSVDVNQPVYTFMARDPSCAGVPISDEYLTTCLSGVPEADHATWLSNTVFMNDLSSLNR
jgi:cation transport regulator ChaC